MAEVAGRKLSELRVCDLKEELENRGLEITGVKNVLIERLEKALENEGESPADYLFPPLNKRQSPTKAKTQNSKSENESEEKGSGETSDLVVDEVGTVDNEDFENSIEASNNDVSIIDNEESINLTIEEEEQKLLHGDDQDEKDNGKVVKEIIEEKIEPVETIKPAVNPKKLEKEDIKKSTDRPRETIDKQTNDKVTSIKKDENDQKKESKTILSKDDKEKITAVETKSTKSSSRNLWVSGLSSITRASDLKTIFSKYGKVIGAKVVTNTRTPGSRCYGYVTMAFSMDASRCIENLNRTELHGRIISVERTKNEICSSNSSTGKVTTPAKKKEDEKDVNTDRKTSKTSELSAANKEGQLVSSSSVKTTDKAKQNSKETTSTSLATKEKKPITAPSPPANDTKKMDVNLSSEDKTKNDPKRRTISSNRSTGVEHKRTVTDRGHERARREERDREREREILSFQKIRDERDRQRLREKERELREEERRRREIRRRQREEEDRLKREREKLALERERLEREKAELLRLERERQKLEREKIELERLELKRQQMKIIAQSSRIDETKRALKRTSDERYSESSERKRAAGAERRFEAPPPPRFDTSIVSGYERSASEKKREEYVSSKRDDYISSKRDEYPSKREDYPSKREEYSSKRVDYPPKRDEFKRSSDIVAPSRHSSSYHNSRAAESNGHKRYNEPEPRSSNFRSGRSGVEDRAEMSRGSGVVSSGVKRYDLPAYSDRQNPGVGVSGSGSGNSGASSGWHNSSHSAGGHTQHSNHASVSGSTGAAGVHGVLKPSILKSFASNPMQSGGISNWPTKSNEDHWSRQVDASQDRYDRTYNERSGPYLNEPASRQTMFSGGRPQERYGGGLSRYENGGKY